LNPGAETNPTCKIDELGLSADYEKRGDDYVFNFQHVLFLMRSAQQTGLSKFRLECSVEVCEKNDASSKCNSAAAVCMNDSIDLTDSTAVAEKDRLMKEWMCDGETLCGVGKAAECSVEASVASCKACTCSNGVGGLGSFCPVNNTASCVSCESGYQHTQVQQAEASCIENVCLCDNGTGTTGTGCPNHGDSKCLVCGTGFFLNNHACVENQCSCTDGTGAVGVDCPNDGDSKCASCDTDFVVESDACVASLLPPYACGSQDLIDAIPRLYPNSCDNFDPNSIQAPHHKFSATPIESDHMKVWYFTSTNKYTWNAGNEFCKSLGLEFGQVHSDTEYAEILRVKQAGEYNWLGASRKIPGKDVVSKIDGSTFWTGMNCRNKANYFFTNGQRLCIDKWENGEPNGDSEFFPLITDGNKWNDVGDAAIYTICEYRCAKSSSTRRKRNAPLLKAATFPIDWRSDRC